MIFIHKQKLALFLHFCWGQLLILSISCLRSRVVLVLLLCGITLVLFLCSQNWFVPCFVLYAPCVVFCMLRVFCSVWSVCYVQCYPHSQGVTKCVQVFRVCAGVTECVRVLLSVCRCYWVCTGVIECVQVLLSVCRCYWVCAGITECVPVLLSMCRCYWVCAGITECVQLLLNVCRCYWRPLGIIWHGAGLLVKAASAVQRAPGTSLSWRWALYSHYKYSEWRYEIFSNRIIFPNYIRILIVSIFLLTFLKFLFLEL